MNTLELKGGMIEMIASVKNQEVLLHLYEAISEIITEAYQESEALSPTQEAQLDTDIEASYVSENLMEHELVLQKMSQWLNYLR